MQELEEVMEAGEEVQQEARKPGEGHQRPEPWQLGLGLPEESIPVRSGTAAAGNRRRRGGGTAPGRGGTRAGQQRLEQRVEAAAHRQEGD